MINVINPKVPFFKLPFNQAVEDFYVINKKKWFKIMSLSFFILNVIYTVLVILDNLKPLDRLITEFWKLFRNNEKYFWNFCLVLPIIECFFVNWYVFVFCTILIVLTFVVHIFQLMRKRANRTAFVSHCFSSMWLSYLIANFIFTNKTYHFLFFIFTLVFLLLLNLALMVCEKKQWLD